MRIYCHVDLDGRCGGAVVARRYPDATVQLYNYYYDWEPTFGDITPGEELVFVDITPRKDHLQQLLVITTNITIIDHHSSSVSELKEAGLEFPGIQKDDGYGACQLAWEYYFPDRPVPLGVKWIAERDDWILTEDNLQYHFGLTSQNTFPTSWVWGRILGDDDGFNKFILKTGKVILSYLRPWYKRLVSSYAQVGKVGEYSAIFINQGAVDSLVFESCPVAYDIYIRGVFGKSQEWLLSITTDRSDIDLGAMAAEYGGGGRQKTAGLKLSKLEDFFQANSLH